MPRILVLDDNTDVRETISVVLREYAFEVACAADGAEGLRVARAWSPHVILLDIVMPDMNGFEFLARAASQLAFTEKTRVVLMTAFTPRDGAVCGARIPAGIPLLTKPFDHGTLVAEITRASRGSWAAARVAAPAAEP